MRKYVRYSGSSDWSALYVDGKLDKVGDHYYVDERIAELLGVETVDSDDFMMGGNYREDAAQTLEELEAYTRAREGKLETAEELRAKAAELLRQAEEKESRANGRL